MQSVFFPIFLNRISFHQGDEKCRILEIKIYLWGVPTLNEIKKFQVPFHSINKKYVILILIHPISWNVDQSINHLSNSASTTEMAIKLSIRSFTKNGLEILSKKSKKNPTLIYWSTVRLSTYFQYHVITTNMFQIMLQDNYFWCYLWDTWKEFMSSVKIFKDSQWFLALKSIH